MRERPQRVALAWGAFTVAAILATALLGLYGDIERKLRDQFHGYGPNLVIGPGAGKQVVPLAHLAEAESYGRAAPFLYSVQTVKDRQVVLAGADFDRLSALSAYWQVDGRRHPSVNECLIGERVAEQFQLRPGSEIEIFGERRRVAGIVSTGAAEDSQILLPIEELAQRTGVIGAASVISVRVQNHSVPEAQKKLASVFGDAEVSLVRAVVEAEAAAVLKIRGTLFLLTLVILGITALCVMNNSGAIIYQHRREIGTLKALGGGDRRIGALFVAEIAIVATGGSVAGFGIGWMVARWLGWRIFHQPTELGAGTLPLVVAITLALACAATVAPLRQLRRIEPAAILRGE